MPKINFLMLGAILFLYLITVYFDMSRNERFNAYATRQHESCLESVEGTNRIEICSAAQSTANMAFQIATSSSASNSHVFFTGLLILAMWMARIERDLSKPD